MKLYAPRSCILPENFYGLKQYKYSFKITTTLHIVLFAGRLFMKHSMIKDSQKAIFNLLDEIFIYISSRISVLQVVSSSQYQRMIYLLDTLKCNINTKSSQLKIKRFQYQLILNSLQRKKKKKILLKLLFSQILIITHPSLIG